MDKENSNEDSNYEDYVCPLCEKMAENPVKNDCNHIYCNKCAKKCITELLNCPKDGKPIRLETITKLSLLHMRLYKTATMKRKYSCLANAKEESTQENQTNSKLWEAKNEAKKRKLDESSLEDEVNLENLLSLSSIKEREDKKISKEIVELLTKPTVKDRLTVDSFKSVGGGQVQEFCVHGIREECRKASQDNEHCDKLHFKKIIQKHTDEALGDCSFLNTCFHMDSCKFVHYEVDYSTVKSRKERKEKIIDNKRFSNVLRAPQWIQCDLRKFDMSILGKFDVIMADPPWDIHMDLPYGTMSDDEMRQLNIPCLQDKGLIFLWVTGRAMELGRECLKLWGYERCDEIIWVKTNQLQRIIRTGRTGHWLNHGKEHCLVGIKGEPENLNRGLDCDVIVAEVRATSHKPDEIYGIIERLSPGTKKIELFGRPHNLQFNWITLGNQLPGVYLDDEVLLTAFAERYPNKCSEFKKLD